MTNKYLHIAHDVRLLGGPDRRTDSIVTALLRGPKGVVLDDNPSLDGWDLVYSDDPENVWMGAEDVLYVTCHTEAAIELCAQVSDQAPKVILRALASLCRSIPAADSVEVLNGKIARFIIGEMLEEKGEAAVRKPLAA